MERASPFDSKGEHTCTQSSQAGSESETTRKTRDCMHKDEFTQEYNTKNHLKWIDPIGREHNFRPGDLILGSGSNIWNYKSTLVWHHFPIIYLVVSSRKNESWIFWWGRVHMCQQATLIFSNSGPLTNLLLLLLEWVFNPSVTGFCRLTSV